MLKGTQLIIGHAYYSKTGQGKVMSFTPTGKSESRDDVWYDGGVARKIEEIEFTEQQASFIGVNEITQGKKIFVRSSVRPHVWVWRNRPADIKSFDYYMCGCGKIISNCGFSARHKCK